MADSQGDPTTTSVNVSTNNPPAPTITVTPQPSPLTLMDKAQVLGAIIMVAVALAVVSFAAIVYKNETALGALIGIVTTGTGFYLRGKVQSPSP